MPIPITPPAFHKAAGTLLNLRIVRGPLEPRENEAILSEYNRLTSAWIPMDEFLHWIQNGPEGPAWHAILQTDDAEIVGHTCLIPLRGYRGAKRWVAAKSEYSFIREEFRPPKIRGFEEFRRPQNLILIDQLFRRCQEEGWGPFLISTTKAVHRLFRSVGCSPTDFSLRECILVLRPWSACWKTPNLHPFQRISLAAAGTIQRMGWSAALLFSPRRAGIRRVPMSEDAAPAEHDALSFFQDPESLRWRYLEGQYERLALDGQEREYVIVKNGSKERYVRVCQWRLGPDQPTPSLITALVQMAQQQKALGVRWAVYGDDERAANLVRRLRRLGFLCAARTRTLLVHSNEREFFSAARWDLTDAMFSFDP